MENAVKLSEERELTDLEKQGLIQAFEFTHENEGLIGHIKTNGKVFFERKLKFS